MAICVSYSIEYCREYALMLVLFHVLFEEGAWALGVGCTTVECGRVPASHWRLGDSALRQYVFFHTGLTRSFAITYEPIPIISRLTTQ